MTTEKPNTEPLPEPMPVSIDAKVYGSPGYIHIGEFYLSDNSDMAYLYDPNTEPLPWEIDISGSKTLSLSTAQAERLRDQLTDFLERQK
jgi:hypothetical protein